MISHDSRLKSWGFQAEVRLGVGSAKAESPRGLGSAPAQAANKNAGGSATILPETRPNGDQNTGKTLGVVFWFSWFLNIYFEGVWGFQLFKNR